MAFFWRKRSYSKGDYYQIVLNVYDPSTKTNRTAQTITVGYKDNLLKQGITDIDAYLNKRVDELNMSDSKEPQIDNISRSYFLGHFLLKSMFDLLDIEKIFKMVNINYHPQLDLYEFFKDMCYAQVLMPCSKLKMYESVLPNIYGSKTYSYDQILDNINHIGQDYQKYIEMLNIGINNKFNRNTSKVYFDCTNYYFEIDLQDDIRRKGPSKENRKDPIIGQALMLDSNQIPIAMKMYPGNESEKPYIREMISEMKDTYDIKGKVIQIADKGLNCARNIYAAVQEAKDGYIFSKSIHGKGLSKIEKQWIILADNDSNKWIPVKDKKGNLLYKYKSCIDEFEYHFTNEDDEDVSFKVKEKRLVTFSPSLQKKKIIEIDKEIEKVVNKLSSKELFKENFGDSIKYVTITKDDKTKINAELNNDKIEEDKTLAGYNLLVTSEIDMDPESIYNAYHSLWRIEHFFRMLKTYLCERPVYLQLEASIYGHFLIGYYCITLIRLLEHYIFKDDLCEEDLVNFIRQYKITKYNDTQYINTSSNCVTYQKVKKVYGLSKLGNIFLNSKQADNMLNAYIDV